MRLIVIGIGVVAVVAGCGRNPCARFARTVCEQAPNTPACDRASRTTNSDECVGLLKDVSRFIALVNEKVETPVLQPPAPPAAPGGPDAQGPAPTDPRQTTPPGTEAAPQPPSPTEAGTAPAPEAGSPQ